MPNAFNHVAFGCRDLRAQEAFYTKHLGFKRSRTFERGKPGEFIMLKLGATRLELFPFDATKPVPEGSTGQANVGYRHLAFDVPKLEPVIERLKADGVDVDPIIDVSNIAKGFQIVFFRDPEGNVLELMENYVDEE